MHLLFQGELAFGQCSQLQRKQKRFFIEAGKRKHRTSGIRQLTEICLGAIVENEKTGLVVVTFNFSVTKQ